MHKKLQLTLLDNIIEIFILAIGIWALTPVIKNEINQLYPVICSIICIFLMTISMSRRLDKRFIFLMLLPLFVIEYKIADISTESWANHSNLFLYIFTMMASEYILFNFNRKRIKKIAIILIIIILINLGYQYYLYFRLGNTLYSVRTLLTEGIVAGGTSFVTVIMLISMLFSILLFSKIKYRIKFFSILIISFSYYYLINIQTRATALIILTVFIILCFGVYFSSKIKNSSLIIFILIIICICIFFPIIVKFIISSENTYYSRKFMAIQNIFNGTFDIIESNLEESSLIARIYVAKVSLNTWFSSPIYFLFGKGYDAGFYYISGIGKHSDLIDLFPKYGLFGFLLFGKIFFSYFCFVLSFLKKKNYFKLLVGIIIVYSLLNGIFLSDFGYVFNLIIPFTLITIQE